MEDINHWQQIINSLFHTNITISKNNPNNNINYNFFKKKYKFSKKNK